MNIIINSFIAIAAVMMLGILVCFFQVVITPSRYMDEYMALKQRQKIKIMLAILCLSMIFATVSAYMEGSNIKKGMQSSDHLAETTSDILNGVGKYNIE